MGLDVVIFNDMPDEADRQYTGTEISFAFEEWSAFFFKELGVHRPPYTNDKEYYHKAREMFEAALSDFPMLSRIENYYCDAEYNSREVRELLAECNSVLPRLKDADAIMFAKGLIAGCDEAIESNSGLFLGAD